MNRHQIELTFIIIGLIVTAAGAISQYFSKIEDDNKNNLEKKQLNHRLEDLKNKNSELDEKSNQLIESNNVLILKNAELSSQLGDNFDKTIKTVLGYGFADISIGNLVYSKPILAILNTGKYPLYDVEILFGTAEDYRKCIMTDSNNLNYVQNACALVAMNRVQLINTIGAGNQIGLSNLIKDGDSGYYVIEINTRQEKSLFFIKLKMEKDVLVYRRNKFILSEGKFHEVEIDKKRLSNAEIEENFFEPNLKRAD